jgi:hypothetical protein
LFFGACFTILLLVLLLTIRLIIIEAIISNSPEAFYKNFAYQKDVILENFSVQKQSYTNSCGPTTISMTYSHLVEPISEHELAGKLGFSLGKSGMLPRQFHKTLHSALGEYGYRIEHQSNITDIEFLERTYLQLQQGIPVPIYFSTINQWNEPNYDTHYSLIIGIRPAKKEVLIANAYGFLEDMPIPELLRDIKYENYLNSPYYFRAGMFVGAINKNNFYLIEK